MQKALDQMNLQLHHVVTDITGQTGMKIISAILGGECRAKELAKLRNPGIKASASDIEKALGGDFRKELLFVLKQAYNHYIFHQEQIKECDLEIESYYQTFNSKINQDNLPGISKKKSKWSGNYIHFDARKELVRISGVDLTKIPGIDEITAQIILSEIGFDTNKWKTEKHFASWLGLCPNNKITGGIVKSTNSLKVVNKTANALRRSAQSLKHSKSSLGAYYRRLKSRLGAPKAITATAHKLARIVYNLLKHGQNYIEVGLEYYE